MQRHTSLRSLSSDHETELLIARKARLAADQDASTQAVAWEAIVEIFHTELEPHFRREEQNLLPMLRIAGEVELIDRTLREHRMMHALIVENRSGNLGAFADLLAAHIQFEEQELFDTAQRVLDSQALADLEQALSRGPGAV